MKAFIAILLALCIAYATAQTRGDNIDVNTCRTYNGSLNNLQNQFHGSASSPLLRKLPIRYEDGVAVPVGGNPSKLVSPRTISNVILGRKPEFEVKADVEVSTMMMYWGQFIDHDITFTWDSAFFDSTKCEAFDITIPKGDSFYDSYSQGGKKMGFCRSESIPGTGTSRQNPLNFPNFITAWIDGSQVYGFSNTIADALRKGTGGRLKTSAGVDGDYPPINNDGTGQTITFMATSDKTPQTKLFATGDMRGNENVVLLSMQTLFLREHNRRAALLAQKNPTWDDETIFQEARKLVIAHIQKINTHDFLPIILGKPLPTYQGYNPNVNPNVAEFFSTVAFRFGHDQIQDLIPRFDQDGKVIPEGHMLMRDAFWEPDAFAPFGPSTYLRGAVLAPSRGVDGIFEEDVRTYLFGTGPAVASDLGARNIQRARDMGLGFYNDARKAYGLPACSTFECVINDDPQVVALLNQVYGTNNLAELDCFVGGVLEPWVQGGKVGPTFAAAITDQFTRIRDGDRFWYENPGVLSAADLAEVQQTTLSEIILRNTDCTFLPADAFNLNNHEVISKTGGAVNTNPAGGLGAGGWGGALPPAGGVKTPVTTPVKTPAGGWGGATPIVKTPVTPVKTPAGGWGGATPVVKTPVTPVKTPAGWGGAAPVVKTPAGWGGAAPVAVKPVVTQGGWGGAAPVAVKPVVAGWGGAAPVAKPVVAAPAWGGAAPVAVKPVVAGWGGAPVAKPVVAAPAWGGAAPVVAQPVAGWGGAIKPAPVVAQPVAGWGGAPVAKPVVAAPAWGGAAPVAAKPVAAWGGAVKPAAPVKAAGGFYGGFKLADGVDSSDAQPTAKLATAATGTSDVNYTPWIIGIVIPSVICVVLVVVVVALCFSLAKRKKVDNNEAYMGLVESDRY